MIDISLMITVCESGIEAGKEAAPTLKSPAFHGANQYFEARVPHLANAIHHGRNPYRAAFSIGFSEGLRA